MLVCHLSQNQPQNALYFIELNAETVVKTYHTYMFIYRHVPEEVHFLYEIYFELCFEILFV